MSERSEPEADRPHDQPAPAEKDEWRADPLRTGPTRNTWVGLAGVGILLVLLIVFILQNTQEVKVSFLGWNLHAPLAVALLIAAAAGILITAIAGSLRVWHLRFRAKRERRRERKRS